jgi:hypothetical protein
LWQNPWHLPIWGPSWSWSYGSWIFNYLCNQCLSPLTLWVRIQLRRGVLDGVKTISAENFTQIGFRGFGKKLSRGTLVPRFTHLLGATSVWRILFPLHEIEYFFQQHWESEYFFRKNHNPPWS